MNPFRINAEISVFTAGFCAGHGDDSCFSLSGLYEWSWCSVAITPLLVKRNQRVTVVLDG